MQCEERCRAHAVDCGKLQHRRTEVARSPMEMDWNLPLEEVSLLIPSVDPTVWQPLTAHENKRPLRQLPKDHILYDECTTSSPVIAT